MSLFVRLDIGFWTHRKTMRLRSLIGDAAFWVPPRLWSYAAQNQPDGDFSSYLPTELAMLVDCSTDAQALLEALQKSGFLDGMKIHGWADHNGYHEKFAARAKKAAAARWKKDGEKKGQENEKTGKDMRREEKRQALLADAKSNACSIPTELAGEDFETAWREWGEYRKQSKRSQYTPMGAKKQLAALAAIGKHRAIAAINNSIANAYQGIFEPKPGHNGKHAADEALHKKQNPEYGW